MTQFLRDQASDSDGGLVLASKEAPCTFFLDSSSFSFHALVRALGHPKEEAMGGPKVKVDHWWEATAADGS